MFFGLVNLFSLKPVFGASRRDVLFIASFLSVQGQDHLIVFVVAFLCSTLVHVSVPLDHSFEKRCA